MASCGGWYFGRGARRESPLERIAGERARRAANRARRRNGR